MRRGAFSGAILAGFTIATANLAQAQDRWPTQPVTIDRQAMEAEAIETATASPGALPGHVDTPAYVALDERRIARIRPVGTGRVAAVFVSPGQIVRQGQALFTYDDFSLSDEKQRLVSAQAALRQAQALRDDAALAYRRGRSLQGGAVSAGEAERRLARLRDDDGMVSQRAAGLRNEQERMARFSSSMEHGTDIRSTVVSPLDGIVGRIAVTAGEEISTGGLPPAEIDDLSKLWVVSQVDQQEAAHLAVGDTQLTWYAPDEAPIRSKIDMIEGRVDPATRHVLVRSLIDNASQTLRPDMLVRTRLMHARAVHGQIVPEAAVQTIGGQTCVFVRVDANRYAARRVTVGPSLDGRTVITAGLQAGEVVVGRGSFVLKSQAILNAAPARSGGDR